MVYRSVFVLPADAVSDDGVAYVLEQDHGDVERLARIRARTELSARINDAVTVGFGLATGGDDPVSTNQTLGDGDVTSYQIYNIGGGDQGGI